MFKVLVSLCVHLRFSHSLTLSQPSLISGRSTANTHIKHYNNETDKLYYRRLARRGGVKRISGMIYQETRVVIKQYLERVKIPDSRTETRRLTYFVTDHAHGSSRNGPFEEEDCNGQRRYLRTKT